MQKQNSQKSVKLSDDHRKAVNRQREAILNFDAVAGLMPQTEDKDMVQSMFGSADLLNSPISSIWWNWGEGNYALYESKVIEPYDFGRFPAWIKNDFDIIGDCNDSCKNRGLESFFSYRINGSDSDNYQDGHHKVDLPKFKVDHPQMLIYNEVTQMGMRAPWYDFSYKEVRKHKIAILEEVFDRWDFDGCEIDFARACPVLHPGRAWIDREYISEFMQSLRLMLEEKAKKWGHPILISARVPETVVGCHFDGLDVSEWINRELVDILTLGCRSFEVEYAAFQKMVGDRTVKLYPCIDDIHASDAYQNPPMEVFRGVMANWHHQGFDGVQTFNFQNSDPHIPTVTRNIDKWLMKEWTLHKKFYEEWGTGKMRDGKKTFVIQRRAGHHQPNRPWIESRPWDWRTPRWAYANSNMLGQLPAKLNPEWGQDIFLKMYIGAEIERGELKIYMNEAAEIEVRVNNCLLFNKQTTYGVSCEVMGQMALGENLIGITRRDSPEDDNDVWIRMVELHEIRELEHWEERTEQ